MVRLPVDLCGRHCHGCGLGLQACHMIAIEESQQWRLDGGKGQVQVGALAHRPPLICGAVTCGVEVLVQQVEETIALQR
ncbi:hypothetical protein D3C79_951750 [compost metagenome]